MIKALNTAATGMRAQIANMDTTANNMANVSTLGFKKSRAEFEDLLYQTLKTQGGAENSHLNPEVSPQPVTSQVGNGVKVSAIEKDFTQGSTKITNRAFDLEIQGEGFFVVQLPDGRQAYTRDGAFKKGPDGRLQDKNGNVLQSEVVIPPSAVGVEIGRNGQVNILDPQEEAPQNVGQIQLASFVNPAGLVSLGRNLFSASQKSGPPQIGFPGESNLGSIFQGHLETSNVNIVDEMVNMITTQRAFETNAKVVQASEDMLRQMNNLRA